MSEYDKEVTTITDILKALDKFENKEAIIQAIKRSLYDIETDWHMEDWLRIQLRAYKDKEDKLIEWLKDIKDEYTLSDNIIYKHDDCVIEIARLEVLNDILERLGE